MKNRKFEQIFSTSVFRSALRHAVHPCTLAAVFILSGSKLHGQIGRRLAGVDLFAAWNRTLHLTYEQRLQPGLSALLSSGYTFGKPFSGISTSRENKVSGLFFKFGPRFRIETSDGEDRFFLGLGAVVNFFEHTAEVEVPTALGPVLRQFTTTGTQAGLQAHAGVTFLFFRIIQLDIGAEYGLLRPREDMLAQEGYYQPGIGYADPRYYGNRFGGWQNSLTGIVTVSWIFKPGGPIHDRGDCFWVRR